MIKRAFQSQYIFRNQIGVLYIAGLGVAVGSTRELALAAVPFGVPRGLPVDGAGWRSGVDGGGASKGDSGAQTFKNHAT